MCLKKALCLIPSFVCLFVLCGKATNAADWSFNPGIEVSEEYNDNVLFTERATLEDFITSIKPKMQLLGRTERTQLRLDSTVAGEKYCRYEDLDTVNTDNRASFERRWSPKFFTTLNGTFRKDEILETELERAGQVGVREDRYIYGVDLSGTYALSDTFSLTSGGGGNFNHYPDGPYPDLDLWQINVNPVWTINLHDRAGLFINYYDADYEDIATIRTFTASLYWRRDLSETTYFLLGAGYRYTRTRYGIRDINIIIDPDTGLLVLEPVEKEQTWRDDGFIFNFELNNDWTDRFSTVLTAGREHYNSIDARGIERSYIRTNLKYRLSETVSGNCRIGYDTTTEDDPTEDDTDYIRVSPYLNWRLTGNLTVSFGLSYEYGREETEYNNYNRDRFRGWITVSCGYPRFLAQH